MVSRISYFEDFVAPGFVVGLSPRSRAVISVCRLLPSEPSEVRNPALKTSQQTTRDNKKPEILCSQIEFIIYFKIFVTSCIY